MTSPFDNKSNIFYKGKGFPLRVLSANLPYSKVSFESGTFLLKIPFHAATSNNNINNIILNWLRSQARTNILKEVELLKKQYIFNYNNLSIKDTKSRWGSCSSKQNLNFSWRLIMAPESVIKYVIVHETAHLEELNHSRNFWKIVSDRFPGYEKEKNWLKDNGARLMAWHPKLYFKN